jgi:hypothetical protein
MILVLTIACVAPPPSLDRTPDVPETGALLFATTDYEVGTIALYDPIQGTLTDELALTGGDPQVRVVQGLAAVIDRFSGDGLRLYEPTDWTQPVASVPVEGAANVHDLAEWGDRIIASQYERPELLMFDTAGLIHGTLDLSAHADSDGIPEASGMWATDQGVLVALQRLDRNAGWTDAGGRLVRVDPDSGTAVSVAEPGPSPRLIDGGGLVTGMYFAADGRLAHMSPDGSVVPMLDEYEHDFGAYAEADGIGVLTGSALNADVDLTQVWCVTRDSGEVVEGPQWTGVWAVAASEGPEAGVWIALRTGWTGGSAEPAFVRIDPITCTETERVITTLEPYDVARL